MEEPPYISNMKLIPLTQGNFATIDDDDFERVSKIKWSVLNPSKKGTTKYARTSKREIQTEFKVRGKQVTILMHRFIMNATDPHIKLDHRDRNGLNNQKSNLRVCTQAQNCANVVSHINSSSKYLGVSWIKKLKQWSANITSKKNKYRLGTFKEEKDAARAYNEAALKYHGEFANLNIIE